MTPSEKLQLLFRLARPHFLVPGFMLYLMGTILATSGGANFSLEEFVYGYFILGTAQLSVSFSNDYFDRYSDKNSVKTPFSGGSKVLVEHPELQQTALKIAVFLQGFSVIVNALFTVVYEYSFWFFIFVFLGSLIGWFYTAPPLKFAYRGLGESATALAIGVFIPGMGYFVASGALDYLFYVFIFPLVCYGLFFILTVELPDVICDTVAEKRNIFVKWGRKTGKSIAVLANVLGTLSLVTILLTGAAKNFDPTPIAAFSVLPLISSVIGVKARKNKVGKQVVFNIASLIIFLFLTDVSLLLQLI